VKYQYFQRAILILVALSPLLFSCESDDAKKYTLAVYGPVHVYPNSIPPADYPGSNFIAVIGPKDAVKVLQITRSRDHTAVRIRLSDGREGSVFSGESIELKIGQSKAQ
jgi:hypothetical protein